jgi:hypothetical protein
MPLSHFREERVIRIADEKYTDTGAIFGIMAVTVIQQHLSFTA